jgi:hypothetical protein
MKVFIDRSRELQGTMCGNCQIKGLPNAKIGLALNMMAGVAFSTSHCNIGWRFVRRTVRVAFFDSNWFRSHTLFNAGPGQNFTAPAAGLLTSSNLVSHSKRSLT